MNVPKSILLIKNHINQLEASDMEAEQAIEKLKENQVYKVTIKKSRNPQHHRKFFALVNKVFENQDKYEEIEDLITELKLRSGHYREHITLKGTTIYVPKSMAFDEMDQTEFEPFYDKCVNICLKYFLKSDDEQLIQEICRF